MMPHTHAHTHAHAVAPPQLFQCPARHSPNSVPFLLSVSTTKWPPVRHWVLCGLSFCCFPLFPMSKRRTPAAPAIDEEPAPAKMTKVDAGAECAAAAPAAPADLSASDEGYMRGFGGHFSTEVLKGVLPVRGNGPQRVRGTAGGRGPALGCAGGRDVAPYVPLRRWRTACTRSS